LYGGDDTFILTDGMPDNPVTANRLADILSSAAAKTLSPGVFYNQCFAMMGDHEPGLIGIPGFSCVTRFCILKLEPAFIDLFIYPALLLFGEFSLCHGFNREDQRNL